MPYCARCGVEVNSGIIRCPLCDTPIPKFEEIKKDKEKYPEELTKQKKRKRTEKENRMLGIEILSIILMIPFLISIFTDLIINKTLTWARYPMLALVFVWILSVIPLFFPKKPMIIVTGEVISFLSFLALLDYFIDWKLEWFLLFALPIAILTILVASLVVLAAMLVKKKGANIAAFILFGIGILCFSLEITILRTISWSLFVLAPTIVIGAFLMYLHYRFTKKINLREKIKKRIQL